MTEQLRRVEPTSGPWRVANEDGRIEAPDPLDPDVPWFIALAMAGGSHAADALDQRAANARLIAAAPELLDACNQAEAALGCLLAKHSIGCPCGDCEILVWIQQLLAKVRDGE